MNKTFRLVPKHLNQGAQNDQAQSMQSEQHPLLFINRFSNESIKGCHGPSRTAVSVHVQRTIRRQKKQDSLTRLRSREVSKGFLKHQLAIIDDEAVSGPLLRTPSPLIHYSRQAPSASNDKTLLSDSRRDQCDLQSERATSSRVQTISHIITPEPSTAAFDNKTSLPQPQSMSAMVALEFCKSSPALVGVGLPGDSEPSTTDLDLTRQTNILLDSFGRLSTTSFPDSFSSCRTRAMGRPESSEESGAIPGSHGRRCRQPSGANNLSSLPSR